MATLQGLDKLNDVGLKLDLIAPYYDMSQFKYASPQKYYIKIGASVAAGTSSTPEGLLLYALGTSAYLKMSKAASTPVSNGVGGFSSVNYLTHQTLLNCVSIILMASTRVKTCYARVLQTIFDNMEDLLNNPFIGITAGIPINNPFQKVLDAYSAEYETEKQLYYSNAGLQAYSRIYPSFESVSGTYYLKTFYSVTKLDAAAGVVIAKPDLQTHLVTTLTQIDTYI